MRDRGAGSILAVAIIGALCALTALVLPLYTVLVIRASVAGAADAAALAAADARVGRATGFPCEQAAVVAEANGADLVSCTVDGLVVTVSVSRPVAGFVVRAAATAGPPGSQVD